MSSHDRDFFRNFSITVAVLAVMMLAFFVVARAVANNTRPTSLDTAGIDERTRPVGRLVTEEEAAAAASGGETEEIAAVGAEAGAATAAGEVDGEGVYSGLCMSCHGSGIPGIPQLGDADAWSERIAKGKEILYANAINGYTGSSGMPMPAKGGNPALSDAQVQAAVDHMLENSQ